jgi:1-phosphofructokinase family hexose kinase
VVLTVTLNPCLDKSLFIPRNVPVETIRATAVRTIAGGKGVNVSRALLALGVPVRTLVPLGGQAGAWTAELARAEGLNPVVVPIHGETRTAITLQETGTGETWHYLEPGPALDAAEVAGLRSCYHEALEGAGVVVFSGSLPHPELALLVPELITAAQAAGARVVADTHGPALHEALGASPWLLKPNDVELAEVLGEPLGTPEAQWQALEGVRAGGVEAVVLSLGADGMRASWGSERWEASAPRVSLVNNLGSGDAMVAGIVAATLAGLGAKDALAWGVACGAANAGVWDPGGITRAAVEALLPAVEMRRV